MRNAIRHYRPALCACATFALLASTSQSASPARLAGATACNLGPLFQPNAHNITGQDGATSIPLPAGGALWLFGDTIEGEFRSIRGLSLADKLPNTAAVVPAQRARQGLTPFNFLTTTDSQRPREVIPFHSDESRAKERLWPMHGTCVGEHIFVFYHRISLLPGVDVFENFKLEGMGLARARIGEWRFERLSSPAGLREFWTGDQPTFGVKTFSMCGAV